VVRRVRYFVAVAASASLSAFLGAIASSMLRAAPGPGEIYGGVRHHVAACVPLATLVVGAGMCWLCVGTKTRMIGRMLLFASILAIALALAPTTVQIVARE
jgi:hypothetical protein